MDRLGYEWLIPTVIPSSTDHPALTKSGLPAVAVDFKDRFSKSTPDGSTDCAALAHLVDSVMKLGPVAVAVDFNFGVDDSDTGRKNNGEAVTQKTWNESGPKLYLASPERRPSEVALASGAAAILD